MTRSVRPESIREFSMSEAEARSALDALTSSPAYLKRIDGLTLALRQRGHTDEDRGALIGQIEALEWVRDKLADKLFPDPTVNTTDTPIDAVSTTGPAPGRVAPLRSAVRKWFTI